MNKQLKLSDFDFHLPDDLIADKPVSPRDSSSLLFFDKSSHRRELVKFSDILSFLPEKTVLIFNETKVRKARIKFSGFEVFFLHEVGFNEFEVLVKPGKKFKVGFEFGLPGNIDCRVLKINDDGSRVLKIVRDSFDLDSYLDEFGEVPLPPYINVDDANKFESDYQTVYAKKSGSVAAPTAGLHFTEDLLDSLSDHGIKFEKVNLQVGLGTFAPLRNENVSDNELHAEFYEIDAGTAERLTNYKSLGFKLICIGTTSLRVLQSCYDFESNKFIAGNRFTNIFLYPGFDKWVVDGLVTNFHLPKSSLFLLISAFIGVDEAMDLYQFAIENRLRFYSFGDASLLLR